MNIKSQKDSHFINSSCSRNLFWFVNKKFHKSFQKFFVLHFFTVTC